MINLIKNEYIKVFRKKGFIILIVIMAAFAALTNFLYKVLSEENIKAAKDSYIVRDYENEKSEYESSQKSEADKEYFLNIKNDYDLYELGNKFGKNSWQGYYLEHNTNAKDYIYTINKYELALSTDENEYNLAKSGLESIIEKIKASDWKDFVKEERNLYQEKLNLVNEELAKRTDKKEFTYNMKTIEINLLDNVNEIIPTLDTNSLLYNKNILEINIEGLDLQLEKNISYSSPLIEELNQYTNSKLLLVRYTGIDINDERINEEVKNEYYTSRETIFQSEYNIKNGIDPTTVSLSSVLVNFYGEFLLLIVIFIFMVAGPIVSQEFSKGTIKMLLVKPYSRTKILLSKYIVTLSSIFIAIAVMFLLEIIIGGLFFGLGSLSNKVVVYSNINDTVTYMSMFKYIVLISLSKLPQFIFLATLVFAMSTITNNTAVSIITGFVAYIGTNIIAALIESLDKAWVKFFIGLNWDFNDYIFKNKPEVSGLSLGFSLFICLIHLLVFIVPTFIVFKNKDIKNI